MVSMSDCDPMMIPTSGASGSVASSCVERLRARWSLRAGAARSCAHALHGPLGDVAPQLPPVELDQVRGSIGTIAGGRRVGAQRGHVQDAAAGGDDRPVVGARGARVDDLGARVGRGVEAGDDVARGRARPGSRRWPGRPSRPSRRRTPSRSSPGRRGGSAATSVSSRSLRRRGRTTWVSGSPKRTLNSMTCGPSSVSISPA